MNELEETEEYQSPTITSCPRCGSLLDYLSFSQVKDGAKCPCGVPVTMFTQEYHSKGKVWKT